MSTLLKCEPYPPQKRGIAKMILLPLPLDRSFEDDDSVDGNRSSSAQAAFKVPKVPKKPADSSAARRPSATGGKLGKCGFDLNLDQTNLHV